MRVFRFGGASLAAAVLLAAIALAAPAGAKTTVTIGGVASPPILAFTTTPQPLSLSVDVRFASDVPGQMPGTVKKSIVLFPHGPRVNSALFPSCNPARLRALRGAGSACPRGSHIGSGFALGTSPQFLGVIERLRVDLYNGPGGRSILFYLQGEHPTAISGMIVAPFQAIHDPRWAYRLTLNVPHDLQEISPGIFASLLRFNTKVGASVRVHGVRRSYIEVLACPPGALVPVRGIFDFLGGSSATSNGYIACGGR
jgi:hypothetical protein